MSVLSKLLKFPDNTPACLPAPSDQRISVYLGCILSCFYFRTCPVTDFSLHIQLKILSQIRVRVITKPFCLVLIKLNFN